MHAGLGVRNSSLYASEAQTTFFRRLTFAPDGSLLFTPAGQFSVRHPQGLAPDSRAYDEVLNTVYIYTRAGFNKPPVAHLPGHKKPSIAVRCCPTYFTLRNSGNATKHITIDTSSKAYALDALSPPATNPSSSATNAMEPPAVPPFRPSTPSLDHASPRKNSDTDVNSSSGAPGPTPGFSMPYRIVYAVASQDTVFVYDTQQMIPITTVSNLHFSTFTDLAWSNDGLTLIMSSSDGFCSALTFTAGELGQAFTGPTGRAAMTPANNTPVPLNLSGASPSATSSTHSTPLPTPVTSQGHHPHQHPSRTSFTSQTSMPSPSFLPRDTPATIPSSFSTSLSSASSQHHPLHHRSHSSNRPPSPTRSNSTSSIATLNNPVLSIGSLPGVGISSATMASPPQTPAGSVLGKRDAEQVVRDEMGASASTAGSGLGSGGAGGGGGLGISGVKRRRVGDGGAEGGSVSGAE